MKKKQQKRSKKAKQASTKKLPKKKDLTVRELARATAKAGAVVKISFDKKEETMDRSALKVVVSQLNNMGADVKVFKSDTDEVLQKKVNEALQKLPPTAVLEKLESIVPDKLVNILKRDCIGLFIDLSDVSCVRCKDSQACVTAFLKNVKGDLADVQKALAGPNGEEKKVKKTKLAPVTRYEADRLVFVRDVKNPNPKGDDYHDTFQRVLDGQPDNLEELRAIVEKDFDVESDGDFMKFVTAMRDPAEGIIKLDVDLSEKNKTELRNAGVEI